MIHAVPPNKQTPIFILFFIKLKNTIEFPSAPASREMERCFLAAEFFSDGKISVQNVKNISLRKNFSRREKENRPAPPTDPGSAGIGDSEWCFFQKMRTIMNPKNLKKTIRQPAENQKNTSMTFTLDFMEIIRNNRKIKTPKRY